MKARPKYNARKMLLDGYSFDSKEEARYYEMLKAQKGQSLIYGFDVHPKFDLIPNFIYRGQKRRGIGYEADFSVVHLDGTVEVVDVKGMETQAGVLRRKLFEWKYPDVNLRWVSSSYKHGDKDGWIDYDELKKIRREAKKQKGVVK